MDVFYAILILLSLTMSVTIILDYKKQRDEAMKLVEIREEELWTIFHDVLVIPERDCVCHLITGMCPDCQEYGRVRQIYDDLRTHESKVR